MTGTCCYYYCRYLYAPPTIPITLVIRSQTPSPPWAEPSPSRLLDQVGASFLLLGSGNPEPPISESGQNPWDVILV